MAWTTCRTVLGVVLLVSAVLKAHELATLPSLGPNWLNQRWLLLSAVEIELVFGAWLLFKTEGWRTWGATLALWLVFLGVAGYKVAIGADSCGCFGRVKVIPWYTAAFDLMVVTALLLCRPARVVGPDTPKSVTVDKAWRWTVVGAVAAVGAVFGVWNLRLHSGDRPDADGLIVADGTIVLEPEKWVGRPFILSNYIDIGQKLNNSDWVVLLYRHDCDHCQRAVSRYTATPLATGTLSVAFVEMPPFAPAGEELVRPGTAVVTGRLAAEHDWFASTPVAVRLHDGNVVAVAEAASAEDPSAVMPKSR